MKKKKTGQGSWKGLGRKRLHAIIKCTRGKKDITFYMLLLHYTVKP